MGFFAILCSINFYGLFNVFMHLVDIILDFLYLIKVPKYNTYYNVLILIFVLLPFIMTIILVNKINVKGFWNKCQMVVMIMLNIIGQL